jgi:hypothetical protein
MSYAFIRDAILWQNVISEPLISISNVYIGYELFKFFILILNSIKLYVLDALDARAEDTVVGVYG